jgi:hypothetical protein
VDVKIEKPKVVFDNEVYRKIMHWVNKSKYEVSGLGTVIFDKENNVFRVKSAMLLEQENLTSHTEITAEAAAKAMFKLINDPGDLKFWWHSHVKMSVFWSGEDTATIEEIGCQGWVLATVFNQKYETRSAFYGIDGMFPQFIDDLPTSAVPFEDDKVAEWDKAYEENVTNKVFTPAIVPSSTNHGRVEVWRDGKRVVLTGTGHIHGTMTARTTGPGSKVDGKDAGFKVTEEYFDQIEPPANRPTYLTKREYKKWKRVWREEQETLKQIALDEQQQEEEEDTSNDFDEYWEDHCYATGDTLPATLHNEPYPFTREELVLMSGHGIGVEDLDTYTQQGLNRSRV